MVSDFFQENQENPGTVEHNANSAVLASDPNLLETIDMLHDEMLPSLTSAVDALQKWPLSEETNESGFSYANSTSDTMYQIFARDPVRAKRFGAAMGVFTVESKPKVHPLIEKFDWSELDAIGSTLLDLGGSIGHLSFEIARATSRLNFVVQDLPPTATAGEQQCPGDMKSRVSFEAYDFLTPQKSRQKPFEAILIANTLQNWPDKYVIKILRNQLPVMKKGTKILVYERPMPETADTPWSGRTAR